MVKTYRRLLNQTHDSALVAICVGKRVLLLRSSYRSEWNFPGGGIRKGETPEAAARRELKEEIGLKVDVLTASITMGRKWEELSERVYFFLLEFEFMPKLQFDNREIIDARLISRSDLPNLLLTYPVSLYLKDFFDEKPLAI
jgi:8-oxo-dGTP diphosphatase